MRALAREPAKSITIYEGLTLHTEYYTGKASVGSSRYNY